MAESINFDSEIMIKSLAQDKIRSSDFSLDGFKTRKEFVDFCQNKKQLKLAKGKLIKLYGALNAKYRITGLCKKTQPIPKLFDSGSLVFISPKYTQAIIDNQLISVAESETLDDSRRLYQYLNWTIRVNKINKYVNCFSTNKQNNNIKFLLINSELHDRNSNVLYMFCIKNDIESEKAQKWQFVKLVTAAELIELVPDCALEQIISQFMVGQDSVSSAEFTSISCIISQFMGEYCDNTILPLGARQNGEQFKKLNQKCMMTKRNILHPIEKISYLQLKGIQTGHDKNRKGNKKNEKEVLKISLYEFEERIQSAAGSPDPRHDLIPIVSILSGKKYGDGDYSVDQVLPVWIRGNWVGIVYRDGKPVMELFDGYDITNKAILCEPTFDKERLAFFTNNIYKIEILPREQLPTEMQIYSNEETPELAPITPVDDSLDFATTALNLDDESAEQEDAYMQFEPQPDLPDSSMSSITPSVASITQGQVYNEDKQEMKYNYVNDEACDHKNDFEASPIDINRNINNINMNVNMATFSTTNNGEGKNNNTTTMQPTQVSMDGRYTTPNGFNTNTPMGFNTNTAMNLNHVPIKGEYSFKPNIQPQSQQLYNQQIYINNYNYNMFQSVPMMPTVQLQNGLNTMNIPTSAPNDGFQATTFPMQAQMNLPPQTPQNTTYVYCFVPNPILPIPQIPPMPPMSTPLIQPIINNPQPQQQLNCNKQMSAPQIQQTNVSKASMPPLPAAIIQPAIPQMPPMPAPLLQQPMINNPQPQQQLNCNISMAAPQMQQAKVLKATTPEFVPMQQQKRAASIPKPASIVPTLSLIKE